jgi:hypothetical protein
MKLYNEIYLLLDDINEYVNSTLLYLTTEDSNLYDVKEIIMYLSSVDESITTIKELLNQIERK